MEDTIKQKFEKAKPILKSLRVKLNKLNEYKYEYINKRDELEFQIEFNKLADEPYKNLQDELTKIEGILPRLVMLTSEVEATLRSIFKNMGRHNLTLTGGADDNVDELMKTIDAYLRELGGNTTGGRKSRRKSRKSRKMRK
jgi:hypothetical protein